MLLHKKELTVDSCSKLGEPQGIFLSEKSQSLKNMYYMNTCEISIIALESSNID